ncbi:MAG TPA: cytochrome P450 [Actinobacteria bacterium]|nr:cytochrome P450 [Actinomycetota bacterium]
MPDSRLGEAVPAGGVGDKGGAAGTGRAAAPVRTTDPFADDFLRDPFAYHAELREAGPVVWLERYGSWGMARYTEVHEALRDRQTYCSAAGVGLSDFRKQTPWRPPSLLLEADPPEHSRARKAVARALSPRTIAALRDEFAREADSLVSELLARGTVDGVTDIAEAFPLRVFPRAVGITQDCGEQLLAYGNMAFNAFGPRNHLQAESMAQAQPVGAWIAAHCTREALTPGGLGDRIYASADAGTVSGDEAALLVRSLLTAGVDTTVIGLGCALDCLARDPAQWQLLRQDPSLAGAAFEETLRYASPVQTFFRTTTREVEVGGVRIGAGGKVLLFLAAANRDPRRWPDPERFDITRRANGHVGFGYGIHACVGAAFARLEGEVLLRALARQVGSLEPAGQPVRRLNNTLSGFAALPLTLRPAGRRTQSTAIQTGEAVPVLAEEADDRG